MVEQIPSNNQRDWIAENAPVIADILLRMKTDPHASEADGGEHVYLYYGSKKLTVIKDKKTGNYATHIHTTDSPSYEQDRKQNEMTILYAAAKVLMEETSRQLQRPLQYEFNTRWEHLARWAETQGNEIFHWDHHDVKVVEFNETTKDRWHKFSATIQSNEAV